jgi:ABC-type multidrug transport system ATPase subunit
MLAKALIQEPNVLLLDEPTNHMDITAILDLERMLRDFHTKLLILNGKEMIWEHFASVLRRDSKRAVPITKLSAESVYLNNFNWIFTV